MRKLCLAFCLLFTFSIIAYAQEFPKGGDPNIVVWVNAANGVYSCPCTELFGKTKEGFYMRQEEAQHLGYRPLRDVPCDHPKEARPCKNPTYPTVVLKPRQFGTPLFYEARDGGRFIIYDPQDRGNPNTRVWVNTSSGIYWCPGSRWYGKTKQGYYASQREAQREGYRPAYYEYCN